MIAWKKLIFFFICFIAFVAAASAEVRTIKLGYMDAEEAVDIVRPMLTSVGTVSAHKATNSIVIKDTSENIREIEKTLATLDVRPSELKIEAKFVEASKVNKLKGDVDWRVSRGAWTVGNVKGEGKGSSVAVSALATIGRENKTNIYTLTAQSGKESRIKSGVAVPYDEWFYYYARQKGYYYGNKKFKDVTTGFVVRPTVKASTITVEIIPEASYVADGSSGTIRYSELSTVVDVEDGVPVILGGAATDGSSGVSNFLKGIESGTEKSDFYIVLTVNIVRR